MYFMLAQEVLHAGVVLLVQTLWLRLGFIIFSTQDDFFGWARAGLFNFVTRMQKFQTGFLQMNKKFFRQPKNDWLCSIPRWQNLLPR